MQSNQIPGYEKRHKTEFFNDYQKPQDMEYVCGSVLVRNDDLTVQFGAHRSKHASDFGQDEFGFLQTVLPHLVRAVQIRQSLAAESSRQALAEAALHQLRLGEMRIACGNGAFLHLCVTPLSQQYLVSGSAIPSACAMIFISQPGTMFIYIGALLWTHPGGSKAHCTACQWWKPEGSSRISRHLYSYRAHPSQGNLRQDGCQAAIRIGCHVAARGDGILPNR